jgi:phenylpropionate dioxygenase-like ring-hydroxylating dioxygenase large terminal subunit
VLTRKEQEGGEVLKSFATAIGADGGGFLSDGTLLESLVDQDAKLVSARALSDPEVFQLELERVFARAWVAVAHESEIPEAGDFVTRHIGRDPVIVCRDASGEVHVLLNTCSHRAMQVCRAEQGNTGVFRCPYHGWTYDQAGALKAAPMEKEMYCDALDKANLGLLRARVASCVGMIFASWDPSAPTLEEYLGDYRWYLEAAFARTDGGMVVIGAPQRWRVRANWKMPAEQFAGDAYHTLMLHRSLVELGLFGGNTPEENRAIIDGVNVTHNGHGLRCLDATRVWRSLAPPAENDEAAPTLTLTEKFGMAPPSALTPELTSEMERHLSDSQRSMLADFPPIVGTIFPNLSWLNTPMSTLDGQLAAIPTLRIWHPVAPDELEVITWVLVERDAPEAFRTAIRRASVQNFGASGIFEQDDAEGWSGISNAVRGVIGSRRCLNYQHQTGERRPADWEGGGFVQADISRDDNQWAFWTRWGEFMTGKPW